MKFFQSFVQMCLPVKEEIDIIVRFLYRCSKLNTKSKEISVWLTISLW